MIRQTGITTRQMQALPIGALFVWCINSLHYPTKLAQSIGRADLKIVTPSWILGQNWKGCEFSAVARDHAYRLHNNYNEIFEDYMEQIKARIRK